MNYAKSRDLAWKILINSGACSLPIDVASICRKEKISLFTYKQSIELIESLGLEESTQSNDAFSINSMIFYDDTKPRERQRFSIAHELGHIFLHSETSGKATVYNREPSPCDNPLETEANIFASRLLAPLCVLQFLNLNSAKEISEFCGISYSAAKLRFTRLCEIRQRNSRRRKEKNHGTFLISKLERELVENFKDFIEKNKKPYESESSELSPGIASRNA
ncbi:MAG: ImmA/IrrE family metallo-endopeptidase [Clostridia bacterium]|nr:ImmA/IrrE family metallo-endopeptidase [Clostridia bacterium]